MFYPKCSNHNSQVTTFCSRFGNRLPSETSNTPNPTRIALALYVAFTAFLATPAMAQGDSWWVNRSANTGPLAQLDLPNSGGKKQVVFIAFEYARRCDPIFSFAEFSGMQLGAPKSQSRLNGSKIGVILNESFYTWHAAQTNYDNGYEAGFGIPNDLAKKLLSNVNSLEYVKPSGQRVPLSTSNFDNAFREAFEQCKVHVLGR